MVTKVPVIAITGSTGKSTTKDMLASILKTKWNILETVGNQNLLLHMKQKMKTLKKTDDAILLELGMEKPGSARRGGHYIRPDIVVFTNIRSAQAANKSLLLQSMNKKGVVILNRDDAPSNLLHTKKVGKKVVTIGVNHEADYMASHIQVRQDRIECYVRMNQTEFPLVIPVLGKHNVYNALFAIAVARICGFSIEQIQQGFTQYETPIKRLKPYRLMDGALLIDDTINANVESVKAAINVMNEISLSKRKILILGSMSELGTMTEQAHDEIGRYIAAHHIDVLYTFGEEARAVGAGASKAGMKPEQIHHFANRQLLHEKLKEESIHNSIILVKGSAGMNMSLTVEWLRSHRYGYVTIRNNQRSDEIHAHPETLHRLPVSDGSLKLCFGNYFKTLKLKPNLFVPRDCLSLPRQLSDELYIPDVTFESYLMNNELHIGPVIGYLVLQRYMNSPEQQLIRFDSKIGNTGLIFMFRPHATHRHKETIDGVYYDPAKRTFLPGSFPLPSVIFNQANIDSLMHNIYVERIGNNIFNYPYGNTDKWKLWRLAVKDPYLRKYFPMTVRYTGIKPINVMMKKYGSVYIRPRTLAGGTGILALSKINRKMVFIRDNGRRSQVRTRKQLRSLLKKYLVKKRGYIVQTAVAANFNTGKVDFRSYIQKGKFGVWELTGIEAKIGRRGSTKIIPGYEALKHIYGLDEAKARQKMNEVRKIGIRLLTIMEKSSSLLGDAAIDFVIDRKLNIHILEVQLNFAADIKQFLSSDEREILPKILSKPFEYARYLAGFEP